MSFFKYLRLPVKKRACVAIASLIGIFCGLCNVAALADPTPKEWRDKIERTPLPPPGNPPQYCFTAKYPHYNWTQAKCEKPLFRPLMATRHPAGGGGKNDYMANAQNLNIQRAIGRFYNVKGDTNDSDWEVDYDGFLRVAANEYSLQMNSQYFKSPPACQNNMTGNCFGWEQFVFSQCFEFEPGCNVGFGKAEAYIQYWLVNYGPSCPTGGWMHANSMDCVVNSPNAIAVPTQPLSELPDLNLVAAAGSNGTDYVVLVTSDTAYALSNTEEVLNLKDYWNEAEYNVFGFCCDENAQFKSPTSISVRILLNDGPIITSPACDEQSTTGETNSLTLEPWSLCDGTVLWKRQRKPALEFLEFD